MGLGDAYTSSTALSVSKVNTTSVIWGTGAYLAGLDKSKHKIVVCTATGSGLTVDHVYLADNTGTTWLDFGGIADHNHTGPGDGSSYSNILAWNNTTEDLWLTKTNDLKKAQWNETITSTGVISDDTDGTTGERSIKVDTGGTSGASATITYPHLQLNFDFDFLFQTKLRFSTASSLAFHSGVGADDITAADSNTRKLQCELCTTTNNNFWLRTANNSANSASDSGVAFSTSRVSIELEHAPDLGTPTSYLYVNGTEVVTKTSNIPTSSTTADNNLIKHSIKNSTAASRPMFMYGNRLTYHISDEWGH